MPRSHNLVVRKELLVKVHKITKSWRTWNQISQRACSPQGDYGFETSSEEVSSRTKLKKR